MGLSAAWAGRWPALRQLPWLSAISDGIAATLGSGVTDATRIAMSIGTSGALRVWLPHVPRIPPGLWCYRADQRHALLGGATNAGGNVLAWALATLQLDAPTLDAWLLDPAGADHGLIVLPFLAGERSPGWAGDITATIHGLRGNTSARDIARAAIEAVTYEWATIAALLRLVAPQATEISVSGGGSAHLPAWAQLIADALGLTVAVSSAAEATSRGLALLALQSLHPTAALAAAPAPWSGRHVPDDARHAAHRNAMLQQRALYERLGYDLE